MSNKRVNAILVAGFACLSIVAVGQSSKSPDQSADAKKVESPKNTAPAQASAQRMHKPISVTADATAKEQASGKATGKSATDDWQTSAKKGDSGGAQAQTHVAAGDVDGDGKADVAVKGSAHATENGVIAPRDVATGQASGKRQIQPVSATTTQNSSAGSKTDKK